MKKKRRNKVLEKIPGKPRRKRYKKGLPPRPQAGVGGVRG